MDTPPEKLVKMDEASAELIAHQKQLDNAWTRLEKLLYRTQFNDLPLARVVNELPAQIDKIKGVQATKITKIVYDRSENNMAKLMSVYSAMHSSDTPIFVLMNNTSSCTEFYIGVNDGVRENETGKHVTAKMETLKSVMEGNFPGITYASDPMPVQTAQNLSEILNSEKNNALACVLGVPSLKTDGEDGFCQGLEKVIETLGPKEYVALLLATPVQEWELDNIEYGYQELTTILSLLNISQLTLSQQDSIAIGNALSKGLAQTISSNVAHTDSLTRTVGLTVSKSETNGTTDTEADTEADTTATTVSVNHSVNASVGIPGVASVGSSTGVGMAKTKAHTTAHTTSHSVHHSVTEGVSASIGIGRGIADTVSKGKSNTQSLNLTENLTESKTTGTTITYNLTDRRVTDSLSILDEQLKRVRNGKNYGAWNWGVYFLGKDATVVKSCSDVFTGILRGEQTGVERCGTIVIAKGAACEDKDTILDKARMALATFNHPMFKLPNNEIIAPTTLVTTQEVALGMSLPRKSLPTVPVFEIAEFGRAVTSTNIFNAGEKRPTYEIGEVFHLGKGTGIPVNLDVDSLCMHTFVTGSTGSGKSNALYNILAKLYRGEERKKSIPFLVIEPAKGEYKDEFGFLNNPEVKVFGTNPKKTNLLRINPFSFDPQIHVMEHIDRLIEILNAAWPMYSAMPAILKDAVEKIYENCGWDLLASENKYSPAVYPDFHDLLEVLPSVIKKAGYSAEVTSNYMGALMTRVKSMTNGYFRTIFQKDELPAKDLFDQPCIVDLSRVGSTETKSLLMGIVFMKLLEHRLANAKSGNQPLNHVTILEEAHNLLRRTSIDQSSESANLVGKSVEMMTNAIAEMRTYGEGFIIADQAPGLLDQAVIRNTNTKIIFRLPDYQDRLLVGHAENLSDIQIDELARLKTGCAAVFQNDWQEAVICQFKKYDRRELTGRTDPKFKPNLKDESRPDSRTEAKTCLLARLLERVGKKECSDDLLEREISLYQKYYPDLLLTTISGDEDNRITEFKLRPFSGSELCKEIQEITEIELVRQEIKDFSHTTNLWETELLTRVFHKPWIMALDESHKQTLFDAIFHIIAANCPGDNTEKCKWLAEIEKFETWKGVIF